jgi:uncharacterized membrane protein
MAHITLETTIAAPISAVFEVLRSPARRPEWMTNLHEVRNVTGQGLEDSWEYTYTMLGRPFTGKIYIRELEVPRSMKLEVTGGIEGMQEWRLTATPDGTTVLRFMFDYTVPMQLGGMITDKLFIERQNERQMRTALENLKQLMEHKHGGLAKEHGA